MNILRYMLIGIVLVGFAIKLHTGPVGDAQQQLISAGKTIRPLIGSIRSALREIITSLTNQQNDMGTQSNQLAEKEKEIIAGKEALSKGKAEVVNNKLMPKDVKDPMLDMFKYQEELLNKLTQLIGQGKTTIQDVHNKIPPVITSVQSVINDIDSYERVLGNGLNIVVKEMDQLVKVENVPQNIEKTAEPVKKALVDTGEKIEQGFNEIGSWLGI